MYSDNYLVWCVLKHINTSLKQVTCPQTNRLRKLAWLPVPDPLVPVPVPVPVPVNKQYYV